MLEDLFGDPDLPLPSCWIDGSYEERRNARQSRQLFIDKLLSLAKLNVAFPPQSRDDLHSMLSLLERSAFGKLQQLCLAFYLAKDCGPNAADNIILEYGLPSNFVALVEGYHHMDNDRFEDGTRSLLSPGVVPDFVPLIIETLATRSPQSLSLFLLQAHNDSLPFESVFHIITSYTLIANIAKAFEWARYTPNSETEDDRLSDSSQLEDAPKKDWDSTALLRQILSAAFGDNATNTVVSKAIQSLLIFPYTPKEDRIVLDFARDPPSSLSSKNREILLQWAVARLTAEARYVEAVRVLSSPSHFLKSGDSEFSARRNLLHDGLKAVMSSVDLAMLEIDDRQPNGDSLEGFPDHSMEIDIAQHAWAPPSALSPHLDAAKSLREAREQSAVYAQAALPPRISGRDTPLSGSPAFRKRAADSDGVKATLAAMRAASTQPQSEAGVPIASGSRSNAASPAASNRFFASDTPRQRQSGSPFVGPPKTSAVHQSSSLASLSGFDSPARSRQSSPAIRHQSNQAHRQRFQSRLAALQKERLQPLQIDADTHLEETRSKRAPPSPKEEAAPAKVQALQHSQKASAPDRSHSRRQQTPENHTRNVLPGAFDSIDDHDDDHAHVAEDAQPEMRQVPSTPATLAKTRHVREKAPEPPTPRRSARLSRSASVETGNDLSALSKGTRAKGRSKRTNAKGKAAPVIEEDEM